MTITDVDLEGAVSAAERFIAKYATLAHDYYLLPLALWVLATHTWESFDCFPYLVISSYVKRSGKTRLMELLKMIVANGRTFSADSTASMFRSLTDERPTIFIDEAEKLNQEAHPAREFLNKGYRRGQTIPRVIGNEVVEYQCFGPKSFVLIGDVYDTLRDRSIVVTMRRRSPVETASEAKYRSALVEPEADALRRELHRAVEERRAVIEAAYAELESLAFLNDRDEELWLPLFAIAQVFCPGRHEELVRAAVDISTEKTTRRRSYHELLDVEEQKADDLEASILLLRDMLALTDGKPHIASADLIERLKAIPTSPWRAFRGDGLSPQDAAYLLDAMNIHPKVIRLHNRKARGATARGYVRADLLAAAKLVGLKP